MDSPLLFPVTLKDGRIYVLDETLLPFEEVYIEVSSLEQALVVLGEMKTRSLGQVLLFFYSCAVFKDAYSVDEITAMFSKKRPTFDFPQLSAILKGQLRVGIGITQAVNNFILGFDKLRRKRAHSLAQILPSQANVLTICNVNGELILLYEELEKINKKAFFYVSETRPYMQGTRLTFWELVKNQIPCRLICDNQAAVLMKNGEVNCVVTGADRATKNGDIINKAGTYALARLADYFKVPFYPLTQYPRDIDIESIQIEERPKEEVFMFLEGDFSGIDALYSSFDITPACFVTKPIELETGGLTREEGNEIKRC